MVVRIEWSCLLLFFHFIWSGLFDRCSLAFLYTLLRYYKSKFILINIINGWQWLWDANHTNIIWPNVFLTEYLRVIHTSNLPSCLKLNWPFPCVRNLIFASVRLTSFLLIVLYVLHSFLLPQINLLLDIFFQFPTILQYRHVLVPALSDGDLLIQWVNMNLRSYQDDYQLCEEIPCRLTVYCHFEFTLKAKPYEFPLLFYSFNPTCSQLVFIVFF